MILAIECILACLIFGFCIILSTVRNKTAWLSEYAPEVQQRFLECNPDYVPKDRKRSALSNVLAKTVACILFVIILSVLVYLAGADTFLTGVLYAYIIWLVVNVFDLVVLDMGILAYWKKVRLPGTEDMDEAYKNNKWKSTKGAIWGMILGIPVSLICGLIIYIIA